MDDAKNTSESKRDRFVRLASTRTNTILKKLDILGNCSNKSVYSYNKKDIDKINATISKKLRDTIARFEDAKDDSFTLE